MMRRLLRTRVTAATSRHGAVPLLFAGALHYSSASPPHAESPPSRQQHRHASQRSRGPSRPQQQQQQAARSGGGRPKTDLHAEWEKFSKLMHRLQKRCRAPAEAAPQLPGPSSPPSGAAGRSQEGDLFASAGAAEQRLLEELGVTDLAAAAAAEEEEQQQLAERRGAATPQEGGCALEAARRAELTALVTQCCRAARQAHVCSATTLSRLQEALTPAASQPGTRPPAAPRAPPRPSRALLLPLLTPEAAECLLRRAADDVAARERHHARCLVHGNDHNNSNATAGTTAGARGKASDAEALAALSGARQQAAETLHFLFPLLTAPHAPPPLVMTALELCRRLRCAAVAAAELATRVLARAEEQLQGGERTLETDGELWRAVCVAAVEAVARGGGGFETAYGLFMRWLSLCGGGGSGRGGGGGSPALRLEARVLDPAAGAADFIAPLARAVGENPSELEAVQRVLVVLLVTPSSSGGGDGDSQMVSAGDLGYRPEARQTHAEAVVAVLRALSRVRMDGAARYAALDSLVRVVLENSAAFAPEAEADFHAAVVAVLARAQQAPRALAVFNRLLHPATRPRLGGVADGGETVGAFLLSGGGGASPPSAADEFARYCSVQTQRLPLTNDARHALALKLLLDRTRLATAASADCSADADEWGNAVYSVLEDAAATAVTATSVVAAERTLFLRRLVLYAQLTVLAPTTPAAAAAGGTVHADSLEAALRRWRRQHAAALQAAGAAPEDTPFSPATHSLQAALRGCATVAASPQLQSLLDTYATAPTPRALHVTGAALHVTGASQLSAFSDPTAPLVGFPPALVVSDYLDLCGPEGIRQILTRLSDAAAARGTLCLSAQDLWTLRALALTAVLRPPLTGEDGGDAASSSFSSSSFPTDFHPTAQAARRLLHSVAVVPSSADLSGEDADRTEGVAELTGVPLPRASLHAGSAAAAAVAGPSASSGGGGRDGDDTVAKAMGCVGAALQRWWEEEMLSAGLPPDAQPPTFLLREWKLRLEEWRGAPLGAGSVSAPAADEGGAGADAAAKRARERWDMYYAAE